MKTKKAQQINALLSGAGREVSFIKDIIQQAPTITKKHAWTIDMILNNIYSNLQKADAIVMKGVQL